MPDESTTNLEARLERLFALRESGGLDDAEFAAAKAAILGTAAGVGGEPSGATAVPPPYATTDPATDVAAPSLVRFGRVLLAFLGTMLAMVIACLGSVFTGLQGPAGRFVCGSARFVPGRVVERAGSETAYNFASACLRPDGTLAHVSQLKLFAVLWLIYLPVGLGVAGLVAWTARRLKIPIVVD